MVRGTVALSLLLPALTDAFGMVQGNDRLRGMTPAPYRQVLANDGDVSYRSKLSVGGQTLEVVPDTGSFELVVFSSQCSRCGSISKLYDQAQSKTYREGELKAQQTYGSGDTESLEAYDTVEVGSMNVKDQFFWEVLGANMPILEDATFQGIFGLGPPSGNLIIANEEVDEVHKEIKQMTDMGQDVEEYAPVVENIKNVAVFAKSESLWVTNLGIRSFSFCLRQESGSEGVLIYNDDTPLKHFTQSVPVDGETYWAGKLQSVHIAKDKGDKVVLGCEDKACDAILDTGTSLIAAPQDVVDELVASMDSWLSTKSDGCSDLSQLPDLSFSFGGEHFTLPPESYVGEMQGDIPDWTLKSMPHLTRFRTLQLDKRAKRGLIDEDMKESWCTPLFMSTGSDPMWILGLPFFRKYYTMFELTDDFKKGKAMHFAEADDQCDLVQASLKKEPFTLPRPRGKALRIDANKLIPPRGQQGQKRLKF